MLNKAGLLKVKTNNDISAIKLERDLHIKVDNRSLDENSLFVAIVGERFNPLEHLEIVIQSKCRFVMCEETEASRKLVGIYENKLSFIFVSHINTAIAELGRAVADYFKERLGTIIAISGSNGKTTTKEMLYHIVKETHGEESVICTQKNNNNHLGVPFSLFQIDLKTKIAIIELGSNAPGEIEFLCEILNPQIGITTNIGDTHLEFFQNRENVFLEEAILHKYCTQSFFVNADDDLLKELQNKGKTFGEKGEDFLFKFSYQSVWINGTEISNQNITGRHNFTNLAVAYSILSSLGLSDQKKLVEAAASFCPTSNRSQWIKYLGSDIYLDAYNANPSSMKVAVLGFKEFIENKGFKLSDCCLVVGDMNELGANGAELHAEVAKFISELLPGKIHFVGRFFEEFKMGITNQVSISGHKSITELKDTFKRDVAQHKFYFIKGSRSLQLEAILDIK